jgi:hypothetical protein
MGRSAALRWLVLASLVLSVLPGLACGNLLPGPEPTVPLPSNTTEVPSAPPASTATDAPLPATAEPTATAYPTRTPTPTPTLPTTTPTPFPPEVLRPDAPARIVAPQGLNIREAASAQSKQAGRFSPGTLVTVLEGPVEAEGYSWWRVESGQGLNGWVADGDSETTWVTGDIGEPRPVNRPVRIGDRVTVSTVGGKWLALRYQPAGTLIRRVPAGTQFTVKDGPTEAEAFRWWLLVDDDGLEGWGAESDKETRWLTPVE